MSTPLVSIITPSFNQGRFIEETLRSVKEQSYPRLEHVVIDGASTDNTLDILRRYDGTYNMRWVSEPDRGHADALCKGFREAHGDILAWLNSDDVYLPGAIEQVVEAFQHDPAADLIYGDIVLIDADGNELGRRRLTRVDHFDFLGQGDCLAQPATFWTRGIYDRVGGIDSSWYFQMDLEFFIRVAAAGRMKHIRSWLAKMRIHAAGKMVKADRIRQSELAELRQRYLKAKGLERLLLYRTAFLLPRRFLRLSLQGDLVYASRKAWERIVDRGRFRAPRQQ
jgi:glycosyltransferase involved in cell wall biosynthesis